ncbi:polysaccharide pyruvyl transferase family protein [Ruegeria sp. Alg231-54]|uniref:polysaccharide pyruvyl transferase family protein n=1 Tax=Ruegeria sp. Alg231-54 TaxID=1922221 RepID=UPI002100BEF5|nr:polysaccharide pyruvyl transferase family protein [Ruegeria sp. Alg231-54]
MQDFAANTSSRPIRLCLFGASPDTANLGVSALFLSVMHAIATRHPNAQVTVFDYGTGPRVATLHFDGKPFHFTRIGANLSRRYYRRDSLFNMRMSAALGGLGNPGVRAIAQADAVLDISGGDSFADIYGQKRFDAITQTKQLALHQNTPLILLPQTYGPFSAPLARRIAGDIVRACGMAWARDERSFETLKDLLGSDLDPARHDTGVDVAFALPHNKPETMPDKLVEWMKPERPRPLIGINVSGLIHNRGEEGSRQFGFISDYRDIIHQTLSRYLEQTEANIVLIPHVLAAKNNHDTDPEACWDAARALNNEERLLVLDERYDAMEMKWVISQLDFFCGTRMHSTIAGLSSGVPTAAIAYSKKTLGVFETCGQGQHVVDPRSETLEQCVDGLWEAWEHRVSAAKTLAEHLPGVKSQAQSQMDRIFSYIKNQKNTSARTL